MGSDGDYEARFSMEDIMRHAQAAPAEERSTDSVDDQNGYASVPVDVDVMDFDDQVEEKLSMIAAAAGDVHALVRELTVERDAVRDFSRRQMDAATVEREKGVAREDALRAGRIDKRIVTELSVAERVSFQREVAELQNKVVAHSENEYSLEERLAERDEEIRGLREGPAATELEEKLAGRINELIVELTEMRRDRDRMANGMQHALEAEGEALAERDALRDRLGSRIGDDAR